MLSALRPADALLLSGRRRSAEEGLCVAMPSFDASPGPSQSSMPTKAIGTPWSMLDMVWCRSPIPYTAGAAYPGKSFHKRNPGATTNPALCTLPYARCRYDGVLDEVCASRSMSPPDDSQPRLCNRSFISQTLVERYGSRTKTSPATILAKRRGVLIGIECVGSRQDESGRFPDSNRRLAAATSCQ